MAKPKPKANARKLTRVAFRVSRLMEFCTQRELINQTGHQVYDWPLVVLKELMDNSLDACEEAGVAPVISITVEPGGSSVTIQDNGGGIESETIKSILDYNIRVSSREAYVSPTRGAQGNALKTILAMGYVLDRERSDINNEAVGVTIIETQRARHRIEFRVDHVNNQPKILHRITIGKTRVNTGTKVIVQWPDNGLFDNVRDTFIEMAEMYTWFNPHLTLSATWDGEEVIGLRATDPNWQKWSPCDPTSPHWYDESRLQRYLAAHVSRDRDLKRQGTVREFLAEFRGLSGTAVQRKVLEEVGCSHQSLAAFFGVQQVNAAGISKLLAAMKKHSKPVKPKHLGIIGREHFRYRFLANGGNDKTFTYQQRKNITDEGIPYVTEFAFGLHEEGLKSKEYTDRKIVTGANWSVGISNPFRTFGTTGEGLESTLNKVRANSTNPVICALHLACARLQFADRGKSSIVLTDNASQPND